ncbi:hypothetical protein T06_8237 [Trichinella sp. T6]|nr:hypothetical protein T06_8237 [Trichinella sp. T6]
MPDQRHKSDVPVSTGGFVWSALLDFRRICCPFFMACALSATFSHSKDRSKRLKFLSLEGLIYCVVHVSSVRRISEQGPPPILRPKFPSTSTSTARCQQQYYRNTFPIFKYHSVYGSFMLFFHFMVFISLLGVSLHPLQVCLCTNRWGVLYACDAQVRRCQARLTAAGEELTIALGSSWPTEYGQSRKRLSELNASGSSNATNTCSFIRQATIRGKYSVDSGEQKVNKYTGTSNDMRTNGK